MLKALYYLVSIGNLAPHLRALAAPPRQHPRRRGAGIVRRPAGRRTRALRVARGVAGRFLLGRGRTRRRSAAARAGGRGPGRQAAGARRSPAASRSGSSASASPGSLRRLPRLRPDQHLLLPLPFVAYRGPFLRADRDGARAILFVGPPGRRRRQPRRVGAEQEQGQRRRGAACRTCPAPSRSARTSTSSVASGGPRPKLDLRLPLRECDHAPGVAAARSALTFSPNLEPRPGRPRRRTGTSACSPARCSATAATTSTSTASPLIYATAIRPVLSRPRVATPAGRRHSDLAPLGNAWVGGFVRYDTSPARFRRQPAGAAANTLHRRLRHLVGVRASAERVTTTTEARSLRPPSAPASWHQLRAVRAAAVLGLISLVWNLVGDAAVPAAARTAGARSAAPASPTPTAFLGAAPPPA